MRKHVALILAILASAASAASARAQPAAHAVGIWADAERTAGCVEGPPGTAFVRHAWAYVPADAGLIYVTLRLTRPAGLDLSARPALHPLATELIVTDYADGTVEWNVLFDDCPAGWVEVLTQPVTITGEQTVALEIVAAHSMIRDCDFVLNDVAVLSALRVNDPDCQTATREATWSTVTQRYR